MGLVSKSMKAFEVRRCGFLSILTTKFTDYIMSVMTSFFWCVKSVQFHLHYPHQCYKVTTTTRKGKIHFKSKRERRVGENERERKQEGEKGKKRRGKEGAGETDPQIHPIPHI